MKTCSHCGTANESDHKFCQQCGRGLDRRPGSAATPDATVAAGPQRPAPPELAALPRTIALDTLFAHKDRLVIGRAPDCDVCLPHPTVSRRHALLERTPDGLRLRDLSSVNGVSVGGRRLTEPARVYERERVGIGPFLFTLSGGIVYLLDGSRGLRLEARALEKVVPLGGGRTRKLLDNISLAVEPGEFVSLLGPSGSGKSTLMDCLNGRRPATGGRVLANGEDFYRHFDNFRQSLGYVPQKDIVHTQLTVGRALYYTAKLRLPTDTGPAELKARLDEVLQLMELGPHRDTLVAHLSGGQIKRVSLGAELLARPCLLYIDEATSGLDAGTEARMMRLFRQLADEGKSVLCITHNVDNVDRCNLIIVLARGQLVYYGPPAEALTYFQVRRLSDLYDRLADRAPEEWERAYRGSSLHEEFVEKRLAAAPDRKEDPDKGVGSGFNLRALLPALKASLPAPLAGAPEAPRTPPRERPARPPRWHQFRVLTARYAELLWGDRRSMRLLYLQAPVVAVFLLLGFVNKPYQQKFLAPRKLTPAERTALEAACPAVREGNVEAALASLPTNLREAVRAALEAHDQPTRAEELLRGVLESEGPVVPSRLIVDPRYTYMLLFIVAVTVLWFGCNNAAKEIVKEEAIYGRERAVNLGILPYLASKFLVLTALSAAQTLLLLAVVYGALEGLRLGLGHAVPYPGYQLDFAAQYGVLVLLAMTGVALGLLLSACVSSPDRANALLPYVLIPQIILGGGIMPVKEGLLYLAAVLASPVYWAYRATRRGAPELPADLSFHMDYNDSPWLAATALLAQSAVLLLATAWFLRRKDARKG